MIAPVWFHAFKKRPGRYGSEEAKRGRLVDQTKSRIRKPSLQNLHLYFWQPRKPSSGVSIARSFFKLWYVVSLAAYDRQAPSAVILELKDWATRATSPESRRANRARKVAQELHPSDQVRGYTEYCRRFHSAVSDHGARVHGCVFFTRDEWECVFVSSE